MTCAGVSGPSIEHHVIHTLALACVRENQLNIQTLPLKSISLSPFAARRPFLRTKLLTQLAPPNRSHKHTHNRTFYTLLCLVSLCYALTIISLPDDVAAATAYASGAASIADCVARHNRPASNAQKRAKPPPPPPPHSSKCQKQCTQLCMPRTSDRTKWGASRALYTLQ